MKRPKYSEIFCLIAVLIGSTAQASFVEDGSDYQQQIQLSKNSSLGGPSYKSLVEEVKDILTDEVATIDDVSVTSQNGYGTALGGTILFTPKYAPLRYNEVIWQEVELTPNCMWGDVFDKTEEMISFAELADKKLFYFDITSQNGYGKPCSAKLGFLKANNVKK